MPLPKNTIINSVLPFGSWLLGARMLGQLGQGWSSVLCLGWTLQPRAAVSFPWLAVLVGLLCLPN